MSSARILKDVITVIPGERPEFIRVPVSDWDDVEKLSHKVLEFEGRRYSYTGWNSDRNEAYFKTDGHNARVI